MTKPSTTTITISVANLVYNWKGMTWKNECKSLWRIFMAKHRVEVYLYETIKNVEEKFQLVAGTPPDKQRLLFSPNY